MSAFFYSVVGCLYKFGAIAARESRPNGAAYVSPVCRNRASKQDLAAAAAALCGVSNFEHLTLGYLLQIFLGSSMVVSIVGATGNSFRDLEEIADIFFQTFINSTTFNHMA